MNRTANLRKYIPADFKHEDKNPRPFKGGKKGKAGLMTHKQWKRANAGRHNGGNSHVNKNPSYYGTNPAGKGYSR